MLLTFDVGNTHTVAGVFDLQSGKLIKSFRVQTNKKLTSDEFGILLVGLFNHHSIDIKGVKDVIISSVVPQIMYSLTNMTIKYFNKEPLIVGDNISAGIDVNLPNPKHVGADLVVGARGAIEAVGYPVIVVDLGTATTIIAVDKDCVFQGGVIIPGIKIAANALTDGAAQLSRIDLSKPPNVVCKETIPSIQAGLIYGNVGAVDYIVKRMLKEICAPPNTPIIATGGLSTMIADDSETITKVDKNLILSGLYYIYKEHIENDTSI